MDPCVGTGANHNKSQFIQHDGDRCANGIDDYFTLDRFKRFMCIQFG